VASHEHDVMCGRCCVEYLQELGDVHVDVSHILESYSVLFSFLDGADFLLVAVLDDGIEVGSSGHMFYLYLLYYTDM